MMNGEQKSLCIYVKCNILYIWIWCVHYRGKFVSLENLSCKIKPGCTEHPPWPGGICTKCQPNAVTLNRQVSLLFFSCLVHVILTDFFRRTKSLSSLEVSVVCREVGSRTPWFYNCLVEDLFTNVTLEPIAPVLLMHIFS